MTSFDIDREDRECMIDSYNPIYNFWGARPVLVKQRNSYHGRVLTSRPIFGPLLFDNVTSDARDHCANERTFLSWLRLGVYMAVVSTAIVLSFHLKRKPTDLERRMAIPFGVVFWVLSMACMISGLANYCRTVQQYSQRDALVQTGWKTEMVFTVVATSIVAACILFISTNASTRGY